MTPILLEKYYPCHEAVPIKYHGLQYAVGYDSDLMPSEGRMFLWLKRQITKDTD
jgi:hypothetical protein